MTSKYEESDLIDREQQNNIHAHKHALAEELWKKTSRTVYDNDKWPESREKDEKEKRCVGINDQSNVRSTGSERGRSCRILFTGSSTEQKTNRSNGRQRASYDAEETTRADGQQHVFHCTRTCKLETWNVAFRKAIWIWALSNVLVDQIMWLHCRIIS